VGRVTISDTAQKVDILDNNDIGLVYDMIVPAVNHTMSCIYIVYNDAISFTAKDDASGRQIGHFGERSEPI